MNEDDEGQGSDDHEEDGDEFDGGRLEVGEGIVVCAVASSGDGGHGVVDGVEEGHACEEVRERAEGSEGEIEDGDIFSDLGDSGAIFFHAFEEFDLEELHTADLEGGEYDDGHDDEADSADPLEG